MLINNNTNIVNYSIRRFVLPTFFLNYDKYIFSILQQIWFVKTSTVHFLLGRKSNSAIHPVLNRIFLMISRYLEFIICQKLYCFVVTWKGTWNGINRWIYNLRLGYKSTIQIPPSTDFTLTVSERSGSKDKCFFEKQWYTIEKMIWIASKGKMYGIL